MLKQRQIDLYLRRIGLENHELEADAESLRLLQRHHMLHIPFENLDIQSGIPIELEIERFYQKVVMRGRGGFCYELNGLFAALLRALGFQVVRLSARVRKEERPDGFSPEYDHLVLLVRLDKSFLVDVGFGDCFLEPLVLDTELEQSDPAGRFRFRHQPGNFYLLQREIEGEWQDVYRFSCKPRRLGEFARMCRYHQTSPQSHFTRGPVCTMATPSGRITLAADKLIQVSDGDRQEKPVDSRSEFIELLDRHFGIWLDPQPK